MDTTTTAAPEHVYADPAGPGQRALADEPAEHYMFAQAVTEPNTDYTGPEGSLVILEGAWLEGERVGYAEPTPAGYRVHLETYNAPAPFTVITDHRTAHNYEAVDSTLARALAAAQAHHEAERAEHLARVTAANKAAEVTEAKTKAESQKAHALQRAYIDTYRAVFSAYRAAALAHRDDDPRNPATPQDYATAAAYDAVHDIITEAAGAAVIAAFSAGMQHDTPEQAAHAARAALAAASQAVTETSPDRK